MSKEKKHITRLAKADRRLEQAEKDLIYLVDVINRLKGISKNANKLTNYYHKNWRKDVEAWDPKEERGKFKSTSEDAMWEVLEDQYFVKLELIKRLVNDITE